MMRAAARAACLSFNAPHEGIVPCFYLDVLGLVTTGIGVLEDDETGAPPASALALPFVHGDGRPATRAEIGVEWMKVKSLQSMRMAGGGAFLRVTSLRLSRDAIDRLAQQKWDAAGAELAKAFPSFGEWPTDGQVAATSMVYAMGIGRLLTLFPKLCAALRSQKFRIAAAECEMTSKDDPRTPQNEANPGVVRRNEQDAILFTNAAIVLEQRIDPEPMYFPRNLAVASRDAETLRELPASPPSSGPVLEDDGGASRREATTEAVLGLARDRE